VYDNSVLWHAPFRTPNARKWKESPTRPIGRDGDRIIRFPPSRTYKGNSQRDIAPPPFESHRPIYFLLLSIEKIEKGQNYVNYHELDG